MPPLWIKLCANTTLADARAAAEAGADAVGFVFAKSRRQVTPQQVREIAPHLPPEVERIGVFADAAPEQIAEAARTAQLTGIQLHGGYDAGRTARLRPLLAPTIVLIETVGWNLEDQESSAREVTGRLRSIPPGRVLVDAKSDGTSGGLGLAFDWQLAARVFRAFTDHQIILAGGLRPENVAEAIRLTDPWGVDVASGVEQTPGLKDQVKMRQFVAQARASR